MNTTCKDIRNSEVPAVCRSCEARHRGICGALAPEQLLELSRHTRRKTVRAKSELVADHEPVNSYANILRGVVKLVKVMEDGRQQIVGLQFAPDFLGRPFRNESIVAAEAATETEVCVFPKTVLERIIEETPEMRERLHDQALKELDEARDWMLTLGRKTAIERVASFLYLIATHIDPEVEAGNGSTKFELPLSRADIADFLGLTIETVSRQFTNLRKAGLIEVQHNTLIHVPDLEALHAACGS